MEKNKFLIADEISNIQTTQRRTIGERVSFRVSFRELFVRLAASTCDPRKAAIASIQSKSPHLLLNLIRTNNGQISSCWQSNLLVRWFRGQLFFLIVN